LIARQGRLGSRLKSRLKRSGLLESVLEVSVKRLALATLLILSFPLVSLANRVDFNNSNGLLTGNNLGLTLAGSLLNVINIQGGLFLTGNNLGTVTFATGAPIGGNLNNVEIFNGGGFFTIANAGGVIFNGVFSNVVLWQHVEGDIYQLSGPLFGIWITPNGIPLTVNGFTTQLYFGQVVNGVFTGTLGSGNTLLATPEPGTLGLLGVGLVFTGGIIRRRRHIAA
jgi:hypothetical protein